MSDSRDVDTSDIVVSDNTIDRGYIVEKRAKGVNTRRRVLVGGTLTGVAAAVWHKPLINTISLPAHAQTSVPVVTMTFFGAGVATATPITTVDSIVNALIPQAHAGDSAMAESIMASIEQNELDGDEYTVSILVDLGDNFSRRFESIELTFSGRLTLGVEGQLAVSEDPCNLENEIFEGPVDSLNVTLVSVNETQAVITLGNSLIESATVSISAGSGSLRSAMCTEVPRTEQFAVFNFSSFGAQGNKSDFANSIAQSIVDAIVPVAAAGVPNTIQTISATAILTNASSNTYAVTLQSETGGFRWSGSVSTDDRSGTLMLDEGFPCIELGEPEERPNIVAVPVPIPQVDVSISRRFRGSSESLQLSSETLEIEFVTLRADDTQLQLPRACQDQE